MKRLGQVIILFLCIGLAAGFMVSPNYLAITPEAEFTVSGTTTLSKWSMVSKDAVGKAFLDTNENRLSHIKNLVVNLPVKSLKSGTNGLDRDAYDALKANEYPQITFKLLESSAYQVKENASYFKAEGNLTLAGKTREVLVNATGRKLKGKVFFEGSTTLKLSDFGIEPPSAMLGMIKSDDDVTVNFKLIF